jgi:E3 ubiquitin-protein ligase MYCBP2
MNTNYVKSFGSLNCPVGGCLNQINEYDITIVLGKEKFDKFNDEILNVQLNLVSCVKCKEKFEFMKGKVDSNTKDEKGRKLTNEQAMNYVENRFTCLNSKCKTEQCRSCKATPYHLGYTCAEWAKNQQSLYKIYLYI